MADCACHQARGSTTSASQAPPLSPHTVSLARCLQDVEGVGRQTGLQSPGSPASSGNLLSPGASPSDTLVHPEHMGLSVKVPPLANRAAVAGVFVLWLPCCLALLQLLAPVIADSCQAGSSIGMWQALQLAFVCSAFWNEADPF